MVGIGNQIKEIEENGDSHSKKLKNLSYSVSSKMFSIRYEAIYLCMHARQISAMRWAFKYSFCCSCI